ncbi:MAG: hypothetical protein IT446_01510 [Phycisphaerales bacterium]|nr:hypothetical protein [Phycisphaerales bacterium]
MRSFASLLVAAGAVALFSVGASAASITYQEGSNDPFTGNPYYGTDNTYVNSWGDWPDSGIYEHWTNYGSSQITQVGAGNSNGHAFVKRALFRFDISSLNGNVNPADITGGTLTLYLDYNGYDAGTGHPANSVVVNPITDANNEWIQGNNNGIGIGGQTTWDYKNQNWPTDGSTPWAGSQGLMTAGTDYDNANPLGSYALPGTFVGNTPIPMTFNVPASLLQHWLGGNNAGVLARLGTETMSGNDYDQIQIVRTENTSWPVMYNPKLEITYTQVPEPAGAMIALAVGGLLSTWRCRP